MSEKINWKSAPLWAKYWVMDADHTAWWCEKKPKPGINMESWTLRGRYTADVDVPQWYESLQTREPKKSNCKGAD